VVVASREQAPGAIPNGTLVEKCRTEPGDTHRDGERGTVYGSMGPAPVPGLGERCYVYWVEWERHPGIPVAVADYRIRRVGS